MEHLPTRTGSPQSVFPPIPYLCKDTYDRGPFLEYPHRLGLPRLEVDWLGSLSLVNQGYLKAMPPAESEPFLQDWLFFGLLHELLGDLYHHEDFVTINEDDEGGRTVITTVGLVSRLDRWGETIRQDEGPRMAVYKHLAQCLKLAYACLMVRWPAFDNDLKFHLASVAEIVGYATNKACNVAWTDSPRRSLIPLIWGNPIDEGCVRLTLLERSNCCPSQLEMMMETFKSPQALAFVASCFQDDTDRSQHASCDEIFCRAGESVGPIPHHVNGSCKCQFIHVDEGLLIDCLKRDCLPLLRLKEERNPDRMSVEILPSTKTTRYVALSHVWADGLGNPQATALPQCQLLRLKALVNELDRAVTRDWWDRPESPPEMLLWCDTLYRLQEFLHARTRQRYPVRTEVSVGKAETLSCIA